MAANSSRVLDGRNDLGTAPESLLDQLYAPGDDYVSRSRVERRIDHDVSWDALDRETVLVENAEMGVIRNE